MSGNFNNICSREEYAKQIRNTNGMSSSMANMMINCFNALSDMADEASETLPHGKVKTIIGAAEHYYSVVGSGPVREELTQVKQELAHAKQDLISTQQDLTHAQQDLTQVQQDLTQVQQDRDAQIAKLREDNEKAIEINKSLRQRVEILLQENTAIRMELDAVRAEIAKK